MSQPTILKPFPKPEPSIRTVTCRLCGQMLDRPALVIGPGCPDKFRLAIEFQAMAGAVLQHIQERHQTEFHLIAQSANAYAAHLAAGNAISTDPIFAEEREESRALCYWTLNAERLPPEEPAARIIAP